MKSNLKVILFYGKISKKESETMNNTDLKTIYNKMKTVKNVLILSHMNPDGDAIGSMMSLKLILEKENIKVDAVVPNKTEFMKKLPHYNDILTETNKDYDLTIVVDMNSKERLNNLEHLFETSKNLIVLDHHKVEDFDKNIIHYIDSGLASATMVIYKLIKENNIEINKMIAYYLYLGLLTDTGGFQYNNTNSAALKTASELLEYGINHNELYNDFINPEYDMDYLMLKKITIENMKIIDKKIAISFLHNQTLKKHPFDTPKIFVDLGRHLKGVEVSLMVTEREENIYKVSLRSKEYLDVSEIAKKFNGGGHKFASGIDFVGDYEENINNLLTEIKQKI